MNTNLTTAELRNRAWEAERSGCYLLASLLWDQAADLYPPTPGQLAKDDIAQLRRNAEEARSVTRDVIRQMMTDWNAATPEQREQALTAAAKGAFAAPKPPLLLHCMACGKEYDERLVSDAAWRPSSPPATCSARCMALMEKAPAGGWRRKAA